MKNKYFEITNSSNDTANISITGAIAWWKNSAEEFTRRIDELVMKGAKNVMVYINTPGGSIWDANEIGNQLLKFTGTRTAKLGALCASAGTTLSTYCHKVIASKNTQYMIHDPIFTVVIEHEHEFETQLQLYQNLRNGALDRYEKKTGMKRDLLSEQMLKTRWMNAVQAEKDKFVDEIAKEDDELITDDAENILREMKMPIPDCVNQILTKTQQKQDTYTMSKVAKVLMIAGDSTEDQIAEAINSIKDTATKTLVALGATKGFKKESIEKVAKHSLEAALEMITEAPELIKAENNSEDGKAAALTNEGRLKDLINEAKAELKNEGGATKGGERADWDWEKWLSNDLKGLREKVQSKPEEAQMIFEKTFGSKPSVEDMKKMIA